MDSGTMRLPKELPRSLMGDGGVLGLQCFTKAKACCSPGILGFFGFGAPAWNDSRCPEKAGEGGTCSDGALVVCLKVVLVRDSKSTPDFFVFIRDTSLSSSFPEHPFHLL